MNPLDIFLTALTSLASNKMRAGLTLLGIVIGVTLVIVLMSMGRGVQKSITTSIESLGSNLLVVTPGSPEPDDEFAFFGAATFGGEEETLTMDDAYSLLDPLYAPSVVAVAPQKTSWAQVVARGREVDAQLMGVTAEYRDVRNSSLVYGSFISHGHVLDSSTVAMLGPEISDELFGHRNPVGQPVRIRGEQFTVIGVLEEEGSGFFSVGNDKVLVPLTTLSHRIVPDGSRDGEILVNSINVQVASSELVESAKSEITSILRFRHRLAGLDDFTINDQQQALQAVQSVTAAIVVFLGVIAGISLLVGGIGIMNIMLVTVTERTREIGIRKAMGARRRDVLFQFVTEAALLSLGGGLMGLAIGFAIAGVIDGSHLFGEGSDPVTMAVTGDVIALALGVSVLVGLFFGIYPAMRASRLHPIEALRYE